MNPLGAYLVIRGLRVTLLLTHDQNQLHSCSFVKNEKGVEVDGVKVIHVIGR